LGLLSLIGCLHDAIVAAIVGATVDATGCADRLLQRLLRVNTRNPRASRALCSKKPFPLLSTTTGTRPIPLSPLLDRWSVAALYHICDEISQADRCNFAKSVRRSRALWLQQITYIHLRGAVWRALLRAICAYSSTTRSRSQRHGHGVHS